MPESEALTEARQSLDVASRILSDPGQDPATRQQNATTVALIGIGKALVAIAEK